MTQMEFRQDEHELRSAEPDGYLDKLKRTNHLSYIANAGAVHTTSRWLLAALTVANSAGFYLAINVTSPLPGLTGASCFLVGLASTFFCGILLTRVHASEAAAADSLRRIEAVSAKEHFTKADEHTNTGLKSHALLSIWMKIAVITMFIGGVCLIAGRAAELSETTPLINLYAH